MDLITDLLDGEELRTKILAYLDDYDNPVPKEQATRFRLVLYGDTTRNEAYGFIQRQTPTTSE
jgi:hypothetical protein